MHFSTRGKEVLISKIWFPVPRPHRPTSNNIISINYHQINLCINHQTHILIVSIMGCSNSKTYERKHPNGETMKAIVFTGYGKPEKNGTKG